MALPVTLRCPRCGGYLSAWPPVGPYPAWYRCPHCGDPRPVLRPRLPAPLFSGEAFPGLYPSARLPRSPDRPVRFAATALLIGAAILLLGLALAFLGQGLGAIPDHPYTVSGTVLAPSAPNGTFTGLAGAEVNVTGEAGFHASERTGPTGRFLFPAVPAGGILLNISAPGYAPISEQRFVTPVYASPSGRLTNLTVVLYPGGPADAVVLAESPFNDLTEFISSVWSGTVVLAFGAAVAAIGAVRLARKDRPAVGIGGGVGAGLAPLALLEIGITSTLPLTLALATAGALAGLAAAALLVVRLASEGTPEVDD